MNPARTTFTEMRIMIAERDRRIAELERENVALKALIACDSSTTDAEVIENFDKFLRNAGPAPKKEG